MLTQLAFRLVVLVARFPCPWNSLGKNTGMGCHFLLQGIFLTQGLNLDLLHCRQIFYHVNLQGSRMRKCKRRVFSLFFIIYIKLEFLKIKNCIASLKEYKTKVDLGKSYN